MKLHLQHIFYCWPIATLTILAALGVSSSSARDVVDVIGDDVAKFSALLSSPIPQRRVEGIQGLSHLKHWTAEESLLRSLGDSSFEVRRQSLLALCRIGTSKSVPPLIALLEDSSWELRENAALGLQRITAQDFSSAQGAEWRAWWNGTTLPEKRKVLLEVASARRANHSVVAGSSMVVRRGRRVRAFGASASPATCPERREALRALRHLAEPADERDLLVMLATPQAPALDPDERAFICEALERIGTTNAVPTLAAQRTDAAAWALGRIGGAEVERTLLSFPPTLGTLLALDRLHSTNGAPWIPFLVSQMAQITYRSHPDDVMNDELQPIQRVGVNLIRRSGFAPVLIECVLQELEDTMTPAVAHGPSPAHPAEWNDMFKRMRSELKPGFVREDGTTTSQPIVGMCYLMDHYDATLAKRLLPLLKHPAVVPRVYVALALGRMRAREALPAIKSIIDEGYPFSDSTALASGKHFEHSQTVRWRGFLCLALGRMGGEDARLVLEHYATDARQPRDVRYSSVVGLRFIGAAESLPALNQVAREDVIWMVRDEAQQSAEEIRLLNETHMAKQ